MPGWMTLTDGEIEIESTDNDEADKYEFRITMSTPDSGDL